jgi:RNA polymerase sigma-70 factor (ECF subfamily)
MSGHDGRAIAASIDRPSEFAVIFDRHAESIRRFAVRRLGDSRADDVVAEAFRIAYERRATFDVSAPSALPWLYGIAANLVRREHRSHERWMRALGRAGGQRDRAVDPLLDVDARLDAASLRPALVDALLALVDIDREILLLVAWEGLRTGEVATALGLQPSYTGVRLHRARAHVRVHLARSGFTKETVPDAH